MAPPQHLAPIIPKTMMYPSVVQRRIKTTYQSNGGSGSHATVVRDALIQAKTTSVDSIQIEKKVMTKLVRIK